MSGAEGLCAALAGISQWGGSWGSWGGCWGWWCCWGAVGLSLNSLSSSKAICCIKRTLSTGESCLARFRTSCKFTRFSHSLEANCTTFTAIAILFSSVAHKPILVPENARYEQFSKEFSTLPVAAPFEPEMFRLGKMRLNSPHLN